MALSQREKDERREARKVRKLYDNAITNAVTLLLALHVAGFRSLFMESMLMDVAPFEAYINIWLDDKEIAPDRLELLYEVAEDHGAKLSLGQPFGPNSPSYIRLWPSRNDNGG